MDINRDINHDIKRDINHDIKRDINHDIKRDINHDIKRDINHDIIHELVQWLSSIELYLTRPGDSTQLEHWIESAEELADHFIVSTEAEPLVDQILTIYQQKHKEYIQQTHDQLKEHHEHTTDTQLENITAHMNDLCCKPQIEQRTKAWYEQISHVLGASEFDDIFASPRIRGLLVMSKANPQPRPSQPLAVYSDRMSAFDWGIRFEPVVKQIYQYKYLAEIKELGRLLSNVDPRVSASPDGLVYTGPRLGRLLEIKCPVSREPDGTISKKYYNQMQSQLFVSGLKHCDFVEAVFVSKYSSETGRCGPGQFNGEILLIESYNTETDMTTYSYSYSPINYSEEYNPILKEDQRIVERITWYLYSWHEQIVYADINWWSKVKSTVDIFWDDVEKGRRGEFVLPESSRPRKAKIIPCLIVIKQEGKEEIST